MNTDWTAESLIAFEDDIAETFNRGQIKAPVHLAGGNEDELIGIFRGIQPCDWVCSTWRSHYHCLLKGVPPEELTKAIAIGRSIGLCFPAQRVISSGIVGGIMPIAVGLAWAAKQSGSSELVYAFIGDMAAETGIVHESIKYAERNTLPLVTIIEDNGIGGKNTSTRGVWNRECSDFESRPLSARYYKYKLPHDHVGTGRWISL
jgi:TPP-dependent pyruvate/acetoin dehydrogenase alpha subunit